MHVPRVKDGNKDTRDLLREDGNDIYTLLVGFAAETRDDGEVVQGCMYHV